jgi:hypothetical protein
MKKKITLTFLILLMAGYLANADNSYVKKVIVVNEGRFDYNNNVQVIPVTIGAYDPVTQVYTIFDTIQQARFASHVIVENGSIYVAADSTIVRYDADSYRRLATAYVRGARKLAVWNDQLLVSRWEYLQSFDSYFRVLDKNGLGFLYDLPTTAGPKYATEGIIVKDNMAYVAVGNGFDWGHEVGLIGRVDLISHAYPDEIDLGTGGTNPEGMFEENNVIYTVNNTNYTAASISSIDLASRATITTNLESSTGCGASGYSKGYIMYQVSFYNQLARFNTGSLQVQDTLMINMNIYGMASDNLNGLLYIGETDYINSGKIFIYDLNGVLQGSFNVGVSPGNIALDIRTTTGINADSYRNAISCYPNPAHNEVIVLDGTHSSNAAYVLTDMTGREVSRLSAAASRFTIDISSLDAGIYILKSLSDPAATVKITKQ